MALSDGSFSIRDYSARSVYWLISPPFLPTAQGVDRYVIGDASRPSAPANVYISTYRAWAAMWWSDRLRLQFSAKPVSILLTTATGPGATKTIQAKRAILLGADNVFTGGVMHEMGHMAEAYALWRIPRD